MSSIAGSRLSALIVVMLLPLSLKSLWGDGAATRSRQMTDALIGFPPVGDLVQHILGVVGGTRGARLFPEYQVQIQAVLKMQTRNR